MKVRLRHLWEIVSTNYWFVPSVMTLAVAIAAFDAADAREAVSMMNTVFDAF